MYGWSPLCSAAFRIGWPAALSSLASGPGAAQAHTPQTNPTTPTGR
jgi:hypothetical protein